MFKFGLLTSLASAVLLTGTFSALEAQTSPPPAVTGDAEVLSPQQAELLMSVKQKFRHYVDRLQQVNRTKLILQSAPFVALLPQFHPGSPGVIAFQNAPLVAFQFKQLMREWNRHQLQACLESATELPLHLTQPFQVVGISSLLIHRSKPSIQAFSRIVLPGTNLTRSTFRHFFNDLKEYQNAAAARKLVQQD